MAEHLIRLPSVHYDVTGKIRLFRVEISYTFRQFNIRDPAGISKLMALLNQPFPQEIQFPVILFMERLRVRIPCFVWRRAGISFIGCCIFVQQK